MKHLRDDYKKQYMKNVHHLSHEVIDKMSRSYHFTAIRTKISQLNNPQCWITGHKSLNYAQMGSQGIYSSAVACKFKLDHYLQQFFNNVHRILCVFERGDSGQHVLLSRDLEDLSIKKIRQNVLQNMNMIHIL